MSRDKDPTRVPEERAPKEAGELQQIQPLVIVADLDDHPEELDGAAGSEFVDDRIRLEE